MSVRTEPDKLQCEKKYIGKKILIVILQPHNANAVVNPVS